MCKATVDSSRQKTHFEAMHDKYEKHYYDRTSMKYRDRYFYDPLLEGIDLNGCDVVDLACGSGHNSLELKRRFPDVRLTGLDISARACADYRNNVDAEAYEVDLTQNFDLRTDFDFALVIGGLHHCVVNLPVALRSISRLVRPGGKLAMYEPNRCFFLQRVREIWYQVDSNFDSQTEAALSHDDLIEMAKAFKLDFVRHFGGPAWCLILNSMICRVPVWLKPVIAPPLMAAEGLYNFVPIRSAFPAFLARWSKDC